MKKILYLLTLAVVIFACDKDDPTFNIDVVGESISFTAFPGGATMHYMVADNSDVQGIRAVYNDFEGNQKIVEGSHSNNELKLYGFVDAMTNVPVKIYYLDKNDVASEPIEKTFNTLDCAARAIFDDLSVTPYWTGFMVSYTAPEETDGFVHIARRVTLENGDTEIRILQSMPIESGEATFRFTDTADEENFTDVLVWSEDFFGNKVKTEEYENVVALTDTKLVWQDNFEFLGSSEENEDLKTGVKYLFDGDIKGHQNLLSGNGNSPYSFVSESGSMPGFWTVEFNEAQHPSRVRVYQALNTGINWPELYYLHWQEYLMPNHVKFYMGNDLEAPIEEWLEVGEFFEPLSTPEHLRWIYPTYNVHEAYKDIEGLGLADPCFFEILIDPTDEPYKYLRMEVLGTFIYLDRNGNPYNAENRVTMHELEVYSGNNI